MPNTALQTDRLRIRPWEPRDVGPWAALNADPAVMAHFPSPLGRAESEALIVRWLAELGERGLGMMAVETLLGGRFVGAVGLTLKTFDAPFNPAVEIGWRLAKQHWGSGYATEAARALVTWGFDRLELDEVVSLTAVTNTRSIAVMERLGLTPHPDYPTFEHPELPPGHRLRPHVLRLVRRDVFLRGHQL